MLPDGALGIGIGTHHLPTCFLRAGLRVFSYFRPSLIDILENVATINTELSRIWEEKNRMYASGDEATAKQLQEDADLLSVCCTQIPTLSSRAPVTYTTQGERAEHRASHIVSPRRRCSRSCRW